MVDYRISRTRGKRRRTLKHALFLLIFLYASPFKGSLFVRHYSTIYGCLFLVKEVIEEALIHVQLFMFLLYENFSKTQAILLREFSF